MTLRADFVGNPNADKAAVLLQAMKQDLPLDIKCRDKFLVQSVPITADKEFINTSAIVSVPKLAVPCVMFANTTKWQHVDDAERSSVQEKKIRVVYLPQGSGVATPLKNAANSASQSSVGQILGLPDYC